MKTFQSLFLFLIISNTLQAAYIKGQIIRKTDTLHVTLMISDDFEPYYATLQFGIKYKDTTGKKHTILPYQANEIRFTHSGKEIRMLSRIYGVKYTSDTTKIFLKLEKEGKINLFSYYSKNNYYTAGGPNRMPMSYSNTTLKHLLQKGTSPLVLFESMDFKSEFVDYIKGCTTLIQIINDKIYKKNDLEKIINYYNYYCGG